MSARTVVVTGSASGMGAALRARLEADGERVVGVDLRDAEVVADLATVEGRAAALDGVRALVGEAIDGVVTHAGVPGRSDRPGSQVVAVNHFGTVALMTGLRPLLARGERPAAVAISSNSTTCQPGVPMAVVDACLADDEDAARALADEAGGIASYPASKVAVARWVRREAPSERWAGSGITLNALAPGAVETPLLDVTRRDPVVGELVDAFPVPVGRFGTATELAAVTAFLLGPDARYLCGSFILVDGGTDALLRPDSQPVPMSEA